MTVHMCHDLIGLLRSSAARYPMLNCVLLFPIFCFIYFSCIFNFQI
uniref:Uncharacterized protein n=1 Tax=Nelumbo nucifera TaxID=4432 RepID=A0A822XIL4_NELNU|nr:TPA_asm: hypothetical protein HUJ06_021693 [Nelumbo nucifera]